MYNVTCVCQPMYTCTTTHVVQYTDVYPYKGHILLQTLTSLTNISHASTVPMFVAVVILEALSPLVAFVTCGCSSL